VVVVVQNPAPPNPIEEQTKKHQQEENEHKENAGIPQSRVNDPNQAHNDDQHQPSPQNSNQLHDQVEPIIPSPNQVHVPMPLILVISPPNSQNQNITRAPLPSTGIGQRVLRVPNSAPHNPQAQNKLVEVRASNRLETIVKMLFLLPTINEQNAKIQKRILTNFYQDYSFSSFLGKIYGFLNAFKFVYFAFCLVFSYSEPLVALVGFTVLCLLSLISAWCYKVFINKWSKVQAILTDLLMILFCIMLAVLILYQEPSKECEDQRMLLGFILLFVNYLFYLLFFANIIFLVYGIVKDFLHQRKKDIQREQLAQVRLHLP